MPESGPRLNRLVDPGTALVKCCKSERWVHEMMHRLPFPSERDLMAQAHSVWFELSESDWLEAFHGHPKIGESALRERFGDAAALSQAEQAGVTTASEGLLSQLATLNRDYEAKFGFIFITCASGKDANTILTELKARITHDRATEIELAAIEQDKITRLRLKEFV